MKNIARIICVVFVLLVQIGNAQTGIWDSIPIFASWGGDLSVFNIEGTNDCSNPIPLCESDVQISFDFTERFNGNCYGQMVTIWYSFSVQNINDYTVIFKPTFVCDSGMTAPFPISHAIYGPMDISQPLCSQLLGMTPSIYNYTFINPESIGSSETFHSISNPGYYLFAYTFKIGSCKVCENVLTENLDCSFLNVGSDNESTTYSWFDGNSIELNQPYPSCEEYLGFCSDTTLFFGFDYTSSGINPNCGNTSQEMWHGFYVDDPNDFDFIIQPVTNAPASWTVGISHLDIYGPVDPSFPCNGLECAKSSHVDLDPTTTTYNYNDVVSTITTPGYYLLKAVFVDNNPSVNILCQGYYGVTTQNLSCPPTTSDFAIEEGNGGDVMSNECESCIPEMVPEEGKKYVVSAWVSEANSVFGTITYSAPEIVVKFIGPNSDVSITCSTEHPIIDGWQLMEAEITIPAGTTQIELQLKSNGVDSYFDDVRFFPYDGSMKSYVYDPKNLRFVAELDERHFATLYEYDEEGRLMRIKKETERGIMTIQESKSSNVKKDGVEGDE